MRMVMVMTMFILKRRKLAGLLSKERPSGGAESINGGEGLKGRGLTALVRVLGGVADRGARVPEHVQERRGQGRRLA
jgi:hypothetical protein